MTLPRFGKIVPIQGDVLRLIGYDLKRGHVGLDLSDEERSANMRAGRAALREETGQDFGYDVAAWHGYLLSRSELGYDHPYGFAEVKRAVREAVRDPRRMKLVARLEVEVQPDAARYSPEESAGGERRESDES